MNIDSPISPVIDYRPDIDGLRALAVLAVLFFHADLACHGGFVGVDIFFVISGFLICSLILKKLESGTFSLIEFWERRIRRILPAWAVVAVASLVAGWFLFLPPDFATLGKSVIAQATLLSNVFFWQQTEAGYFAVSPDTMPLLHTWSLAVEEQFYVFFPLLLLIPMGWKRITFFELIVCLWVASFIQSVTVTPQFPALAFYFLPMRAWELLTGALLVVGNRNLPANKVVREISGWLGLGLMLYAIFCFNRHTQLPGLAALIPCSGAAFFILSSNGDFSLVGRMFAFRPLVFIGLISYSLYLWHWPLLVFARYLATEELSLSYRLGLLATSLGLAILSWKFIEIPIRTRRIIKVRWQIFGMAGGCGVMLVLLGLIINQQRGWPQRLSPSAWKYLNVAGVGAETGRFVALGPQSTNQPIFVMICGDSHATAASPAIDELCRKYSCRGVQATLALAVPIVGFTRNDFDLAVPNDGPSIGDAFVRFAARNHVRNVILAARWHLYWDTWDSDAFKANLAYKTNLALTIRELLDSGAKVYLLKDVPAPDFDVPRVAAVMAMNHRNVDALSFSGAKYEAAERDLRPTFEMAQRLGAVVLDPSRFFLNPENRYRVAWDNELLYCDDNHLTGQGARLLLPLFEPIFKAN